MIDEAEKLIGSPAAHELERELMRVKDLRKVVNARLDAWVKAGIFKSRADALYLTSFAGIFTALNMGIDRHAFEPAMEAPFSMERFKTLAAHNNPGGKHA